MPGVKATSRFSAPRPARTGGSAAQAFTLLDLLVSIAVIAILIALMLPSIAGVRELTRRVICASNTRQIGLGIAMYAEDYKGELPYSEYVAKFRALAQPQNMIIIRQDSSPERWDGLGLLFSADYLNASQVFYCPSHAGDHPYKEYAAKWAGADGRIIINYQYRGQNLGGVTSDRIALLTDGLRSQSDFSHKVGSNVLRADFSVQWLADPIGVISRALPKEQDGDSDAASKVSTIWWTIDDSAGTIRGDAGLDAAGRPGPPAP